MENSENKKQDDIKNKKKGVGIIDKDVRIAQQKIHGGPDVDMDDNEIENTDLKGFEKTDLN